MDKYEKELEDEIKKLQECQSDNGLKSCMPCKLYIECEIRKKYVSTVYKSMSKGKTGGFEF